MKKFAPFIVIIALIAVLGGGGIALAHPCDNPECAGEKIAKAEAKVDKVLQEAEDEGIDLPDGVLDEFNDLLAQAQAAFDAEDFELAEDLAKQAKKSLDSVEDTIDDQEDAQKEIQKAQEEQDKVIAEADKEDVDLPDSAFDEFNILLAQAQAAFDAEDFELAEDLAEQAEKSLKSVEDDIKDLEDELHDQQKAEEAIAEAQEEQGEVIAEADKEGVVLPGSAFDTFNALLAQAQAAFDAGDSEQAEELAEQAEDSLDDVEDLIDELEDEMDDDEDDDEDEDDDDDDDDDEDEDDDDQD